MSCSQKHFESYFDPDHTKIKISAGTEHIPKYIQSLLSLSPNVNNDESTDVEINKVTKNVSNNKASLEIEDEILKRDYLLPEFNNKLLYCMKGVYNLKCIPQNWL